MLGPAFIKLQIFQARCLFAFGIATREMRILRHEARETKTRHADLSAASQPGRRFSWRFFCETARGHFEADLVEIFEGHALLIGKAGFFASARGSALRGLQGRRRDARERLRIEWRSCDGSRRLSAAGSASREGAASLRYLREKRIH